jgi:drug/metabolite transporter (DMT)-like permease
MHRYKGHAVKQINGVSQMLNSQLIMLFSIFCFSLAGFFSSLLTVESLAFAMLIRFSIPSLLSMFSIRQFASSFKGNPSLIFLCLLRGAVIFLSQYFLYLTINKMGLSSGLILYNLGPLFLILIFTLLGNKIKMQDVALITICFIGVLVFFKFEFRKADAGFIIGIIAAVLYAISQFINARMAKEDADPRFTIFLVNLSAAVIAGGYLFAFMKPGHLNLHMEMASVLTVAGMGLATYFNQYFRISAFKRTNAPATLVYLTYFCIPFSLVFTYLHGDLVEPSHLYGTFIILAGTMLQWYANSKPKKVFTEEAVAPSVP